MQPLFVYTLPLKTNKTTEKQLEDKFRIAGDIYKASIKECLRRERAMKKDPRHKEARKMMKDKNYRRISNIPAKEVSKQDAQWKKKHEKKRNEILRALDVEYGLAGRFDISTFANVYRKSRGYMSFQSAVAVKLGERAYRAFEKVKFNKGAKRVRVKSQVDSMEAGGDYGIYVRNGQLKFKGVDPIPVDYKEDVYEEEALRNTIKYHRLIRKMVNGKPTYYVQFILDGIPPQESTHNISNTSVGIDIGTSSIAVSSHYQTELYKLADEIKSYDDEIRALQRQLDRQRRVNNPDNYNPNGTVKSGYKKWNNSKRYLKTRDKIANLKRKQTETRKLAHKTIANLIVQMGDRFVVESMSFAGLAACAKETTINEKTGKFKKKKRFGKSIGFHAPAELIQQIKYKAEYAGKTFITASTATIKASQLDHSTGGYTKSKLSDRSKTIANEKVQRDLYSAFLLEHVLDDGKTVDLEACLVDFDKFLENQAFTIDKLILSGKHSQTMGIRDFLQDAV